MQDVSELAISIQKASDAYFKCSMEAGEIAERSGTAWLELRKTTDTDTQCNREWSRTADGRREAYLKFYLKGLEKKISGDKLRLRILTGNGG